jgi:hypothetical protein
MWGSFFSGGKDPLKDLGYEILPDSQTTTNNPRSIWTILNGKKKVIALININYLSKVSSSFFFL